MYQAIHNYMETTVPKPREEVTSPIAIAKPVNVQYDPALLLHPPGCLVHVTMTKDHPQVKDSSLGPRALEGIFFGNEPSSRLVRAYIPSLGRMVLANKVNIFPDPVPFLEPCFHDMRGFTERDLANLRRPLRSLATKKSERLAQLKEAAESIAPLAHTQGNSTNMVDAHTQGDDAPPQASPTKLAEQHIANLPDHQLAEFVSTRQLQMHFAAGRF